MTKTSKITYTAIFAAIATVLMYFEFPIPFMPPSIHPKHYSMVPS